MPAKKTAAKKTAAKKTAKTQPSGGVAVKTDQIVTHKGGVAVRIPDAPAQIAGAESGQSAGTEEN